MTVPFNIKKEAFELRKNGYSYSMISKKIGLSKSTLSCWLKEIKFQPNKIVIKRIGEAKMKSARKKQEIRQADIKQMGAIARKEVAELNNRDLFMLGLGLYLGEGSKLNEYTRIVNSDPNIIKLAIRWFKEICKLKNQNFTPAIHLYPDTNHKKSLTYWSKITGLPKKQFGKTQIDQRTNKLEKKKGKLINGTLHLYIKSCGDHKLGRSLHRKIIGWIEAVYNQIN